MEHEDCITDIDKLHLLNSKLVKFYKFDVPTKAKDIFHPFYKNIFALHNNETIEHEIIIY